MIVKTNIGALKQTRWYEYATRFVLGGLITAIAGLVANHWGPAAGGLFLAFPAICPAAATLVAKHEQKKKQKNGVPAGRRGEAGAAVESTGAIFGSAGLAVFAGLNWYLLGAGHPVLVLAVASLSWLSASVLFWAAWKFRRRLTMNAPFSAHAGRFTASETLAITARSRSAPVCRRAPDT